MKPVEIEFLIQDHTGTGARKVAASINREVVSTVGKMDSIHKKIDKLRESSANSLDQTKNIAEIAKLEKQLDKLQSKLKQASVAGKDVLPKPEVISQATRQYNGLNMSIQQIARELPSLAMGPQMFFMAISNNLPIFSDELARARKEYQATVAAGQKGIPVWKQIASSIVSWQTLLVAGIMLLVSYGDEIGNWVKRLIKGAEAINTAKLSMEQFHSTMAQGRVAAQKEVTQLDLLYRIATDTSRSYEERKNAISELQQIYPAYFANLSQEQIMLGKAITSYQELRAAILQTAEAKAAEGKIVSIAEDRQILDATKSMQKYAEVYDKAQEARRRYVVAYQRMKNTEGTSAFLPAAAKAEKERAIYAEASKELKQIQKSVFSELKKIEGGEDLKEKIKEYYNNSLLKYLETQDALKERLSGIASKAYTVDTPDEKNKEYQRLMAVRPDSKSRELLLDALRDLEDAQTATMRDGYEKRRKEAQIQFERQLHDIQENRRKLLEADAQESGGGNAPKINTLFDSQIEAVFQSYQNSLKDIEREQQAEASEAYNNLLLKYETYLQKRERLAREYDKDIQALSASPDNQLEAEKAKEKALQDVDVAFAGQFPQFEEWANSIVTLSIEKLRELLAVAQAELDALEESGDSNPETRAKVNAAISKLQNNIKNTPKPQLAPEDGDFKKWAELSEVLGRASNEFAELGSQVDGTLGEIMTAAGEIATASTSAISGILELSKSSTKAVEGTTEAAAASMSKLEKASVILTVISAAFSVFNAIGNLFNRTESEQEKSLRLAREFNAELQVMRERSLINQDDNSIFGKAVYENFRRNVEAMRNASQGIKDSEDAIKNRRIKFLSMYVEMPQYDSVEHSLGNMMVKTRSAKWYRAAKYASLKDLVPALFGDDGQIDMEALKAFANESNSVFSKLSADNQALIKQLVADWETYEQAMDGVRDYLTSVFGDLGDTMFDAMMKVSDGLQSTEDAMADMVDSVSKMLRQWVSDMIYAATLAPLLADAQKDIEAIVTGEGTDEEKTERVMEVFDNLLRAIPEAQEAANKYYEAYKALAAQYGYDIGPEGTGQTGVAGAMHTVSQESFTRMEGILTSIQAHIAERDLSLDNITDILLSQLEATRAVVSNTAVLPLLYSLLNKMNQYGINVR